MQLKQLSDQELREFLSKPWVAKIATTSANGDIRMTPIWFEHQDDGSILTNTFKDSGLVKNIHGREKASFMVDSTEWPYYGVHFWGTATVEGPEDDVEGIAKMYTPYVGTKEGAVDYAKTLISYGTRVYVRFRPSRKTSWDFRQ